MNDEEVSRWFCAEVLPLEANLVRFLRKHWWEAGDIDDLRQEVFTRMFEQGRRQPPPESALAFMLTVARNLLVDTARRKQVVSIEAYADVDALAIGVEELTPERHHAGRSELRRLQAALDRLPARCREVVQLRKVDGLSQREVAARMGIAEDTVERQVSKGIRALAAALADEDPPQQAGSWAAKLRLNVRKTNG
ncbi:RNA polymerase sigma factor [Roseateles sp. LYH14W]|uniref:RNA polymerase sigma factor n=1 Tax=Pelomonas parva TaxID=3299032 RepID=A0ABW7F4Y6_9BURK